MAIIGWAKLWERQGQDIAEFPHMKRWLDTVLARPAVQRGFAASAEKRDSSGNRMQDPKVQEILFGNKPK
jgi:GST-like protein